MDPSEDLEPISAAKKAARKQLRKARAERTPEERSRLNAILISNICELLNHYKADLATDKSVATAHTHLTVAAYDPLPNEPGGPELVERLAQVCDTVWLPITEDNGRLSWTEFTGRENMVLGAMGIKEPAGPRHTSEILASCNVILVPAMGTNSAGQRMGKGGGFYDRALERLSTPPLRVAVLFDGEIVPDLPMQPHDATMDCAVTPSGVTYF